MLAMHAMPPMTSHAWLKIPAPTPYLSVQCKRSRHLMFERKCAGSIFGVHVRRSTSGASQAANLLVVKSILHDAGVFRNHDKVSMTDDYFWKLVRKRTNVGSEMDKQKEIVPFTKHEQMLHGRLCTNDYILENDYGNVEDAEYYDDDISVVSSCIGSVDGHDDIIVKDHETTNSPDDLEQWKALTEAEKVKDGVDALKKLGNVKRRKCNKLALTDGFVEGNDLLMKTIKQDRQKAIQKMRRKFDLVEMAISYFVNKMTKRRAVLIRAIEKSKTQVFHPTDRQVRYRDLMKARRLAGLTNPQDKK